MPACLTLLINLLILQRYHARKGVTKMHSITLNEVIEHAEKWFYTVSHGGTASEQAAYFLYPDSRIYVTQNGVAFDFEQHQALHSQWINEQHEFGEFSLIQLNEKPYRVRATGTVYWQAENSSRPKPNIIKAVVGEDWILERTPDGEIKFILYISSFLHTLPDSAPLEL